MCKNTILMDIYQSAEINQVMLKVQPDYIRDDLKQHVFLLLLEKPEDFIMERYENGKLKAYIVSTIYNLIHFKEDKFHRVQRRATEKLTDFTIIDYSGEPSDNVSSKAIYDNLLNDYLTDQSDKESIATEEACAKHLEKTYWYNQELLKWYLVLGNYRAVSKQTGIPVKSVYNAIQIAKKQIKKMVACQQ